MVKLDPNPINQRGRTRRGNRLLLLVPSVLALALAGPSPSTRIDPEVGPTLTSLGLTRPDGTPVGVVGGRERFRLLAEPGKTFREVVWEIEGAIASQEITVERGFVNTPLPNPLVIRPPRGSTESVVEFFWDGAGGKHSIRVTAYYTDGTVAEPEGFSPSLQD